jgi:hypothetical protein
LERSPDSEVDALTSFAGLAMSLKGTGMLILGRGCNNQGKNRSRRGMCRVQEGKLSTKKGKNWSSVGWSGSLRRNQWANEKESVGHRCDGTKSHLIPYPFFSVTAPVSRLHG